MSRTEDGNSVVDNRPRLFGKGVGLYSPANDVNSLSSADNTAEDVIGLDELLEAVKSFVGFCRLSNGVAESRWHRFTVFSEALEGLVHGFFSGLKEIENEYMGNLAALTISTLAGCCSNWTSRRERIPILLKTSRHKVS